jgi:hypothetical protein
MKNRLTFRVMLLAALALPAPLFAQEIDAHIEGAKLCTRNLARYERQYGIPMHLLSAISATESGRYHKGLQITIPWPWTINVEGQGHYYDTKEQAIAAVRKYQLQGARSIDIGCMQVNLIHHPNAFSSLDEAFDPESNVAYGASFLRSLYEENKSWKQASAHYHSKTPTRGSEYVSRVYDRWTNIINRLREAKTAIPESAVAALNEKSLPAKPVELIQAAAYKAPEPKAIEPKTIAVKPAVARSVARMNSISVTNVETRDMRDSGVLVIRPKITVVDDGMSIAHAVPVSQPDSARVIHVADSQATPQAASGPRFIFEN